MSIAALALKACQPDPGSGIANNTVNQSLEQGIYTLNLQWAARLDSFADAGKFLLDTKVGQGAHSEL